MADAGPGDLEEYPQELGASGGSWKLPAVNALCKWEAAAIKQRFSGYLHVTKAGGEDA